MEIKDVKRIEKMTWKIDQEDQQFQFFQSNPKFVYFQLFDEFFHCFSDYALE